MKSIFKYISGDKTNRNTFSGGNKSLPSANDRKTLSAFDRSMLLPMNSKTTRKSTKLSRKSLDDDTAMPVFISGSDSEDEEVFDYRRYFQLFDAEDDPFYFEMDTAELYWSLPNGALDLDNIVYRSHKTDDGIVFESTDGKSVMSKDPPLHDFSQKAQIIFPSILGRRRKSIEKLIGKEYIPSVPVKQNQILDNYIDGWDDKTTNREHSPLVATLNESNSNNAPMISTDQVSPNKSNITKVQTTNSDIEISAEKSIQRNKPPPPPPLTKFKPPPPPLTEFKPPPPQPPSNNSSTVNTSQTATITEQAKSQNQSDNVLKARVKSINTNLTKLFRGELNNTKIDGLTSNIIEKLNKILLLDSMKNEDEIPLQIVNNLDSMINTLLSSLKQETVLRIKADENSTLLRESLNQVSSDNSKLNSNLQNCTSKLQQLEKDYEEICQYNQEYIQHNEILQDNLLSVENSYNDIIDKYDTLNNDYQTLSQEFSGQISLLQDKADKHQQQFIASDQQYNELKSNFNVIEETNNELIEQISLLQQQLADSEEEKNHLCQIKDEEIEKLKEQIIRRDNKDYIKYEFNNQNPQVISIIEHIYAVNELQSKLDEALELSNKKSFRHSSTDEMMFASSNPFTPNNTIESPAVNYESINSTQQNEYHNQEEKSNAIVSNDYLLRRVIRLYSSQRSHTQLYHLTQFFPFELSTLDYYHRIFQIISSGIRGIVLEFIEEHRNLLDVLPVFHYLNSDPSMNASGKNGDKRALSSSKKSSLPLRFIIHNNDTTNRYLNRSQQQSMSPSFSADYSINSPSQFTPKSHAAYYSTLKYRQFIKLSSNPEFLSFEDMINIILVVNVPIDNGIVDDTTITGTRAQILNEHAYKLGFSSINELITVCSKLLSWYRQVHQQITTQSLDNGKLNFNNFREIIYYGNLLLETIYYRYPQKSGKSGKSGVNLYTNDSLVDEAIHGSVSGINGLREITSLSINELNNMKKQIELHIMWKERRMNEMGWIWDDNHVVEVEYKSLENKKLQYSETKGEFDSIDNLATSQQNDIRASTCGLSSLQSPPSAIHTGVKKSNTLVSPVRSISSAISAKYSGRINESPLRLLSNGSQLTTDQIVNTFQGLKVKLFAALEPSDIAVIKIIIRLLGFQDLIKLQLTLMEANEQPRSNKRAYADPEQSKLEQLQELYEGVHTILCQLDESSALSNGFHSHVFQQQVGEETSPTANYNSFNNSAGSVLSRQSTSQYYAHSRLRIYHHLLKHSVTILTELGILPLTSSHSSSNHLENSSGPGAEQQFSENRDLTLLIISVDKIDEAIDLHRSLQTLVAPFDAAENIDMYMQSHPASHQYPNSQLEITSNLIYHLTNPIDNESIASLTIAAGYVDIVQLIFQYLPNLLLHIPASVAKSDDSDTQNGEEGNDLTEESFVPVLATRLNLSYLDFNDIFSLQSYGYLVTEVFYSKRFNCGEILQRRCYSLLEIKQLTQLRVEDLYLNQYSIMECIQLGFTVNEIRAGGYHDDDIINANCFTLSELKTAGIDLTRFALIQLYLQCNGNLWNRQMNWCSTRPIEEWQGIFLNGAKRIFKIDLKSNNLSGQLPESLFLLSSLEYLDLSNNRLTGPIPESLLKLKRLTDLWLNDNRFEVTPYTRPTLQSILTKCRIRL